MTINIVNLIVINDINFDIFIVNIIIVNTIISNTIIALWVSQLHIDITIDNIVKQLNCNRVMNQLFVCNFFSTAAIGEV